MEATERHRNLSRVLGELLLDGKERDIPIRGTSMYPVLHQGQEVTIRPVQKLTPGRCYVYRWNRQFVLHRLARCTGKSGIFTGDNCLGAQHVPIFDVVAELAPRSYDRLHQRVALVDRALLGFLIRSAFLLRLRRKMLHTLYRTR